MVKKKNVVNSSRGSVCQYCGKRTYASRKDARHASTVQYPSEIMSVYTCRKLPDYVDENLFWHIGHLTDAVRKGNYSRDDVYSRTGPPSAPPFSTGDAPPEAVKRQGLPPALKRAMIESLGQKKAAGQESDTDNDKEGNHGDNR